MSEIDKLEVKPKSKIIAILLNIFALGAGYFYIGKIKLGILFIPIIIVFHFLSIYISSFFNSAYIIIISIILTFIFMISSFIIPSVLIYKNKYKISKYSKWPYIIIFIISVNIFGLFFLEFITENSPARIFRIPASSMQDTVKIGDQLIAYKTKKIKRGDLVVFQYPKNPEIFYLKRIIAKEGDIVAIKNKNLLLHLNEGNKFIEDNFKNYKTTRIGDNLFIVNPYIKKFKGIHNDLSVVKDNYQPYQLFDMMQIQIPKNEYFVMGDNRDHSNDSRFWGTVPKELIYGKTNFIYINLTDLKRFNLKIK